MSRKIFTKEEIQLLRNNPYTFNVTSNSLFFTKAFKEQFYKEYSEGAKPRQILERYGYPADVLGERRIWGIGYSIKKEMASSKDLYEGRPINSTHKQTTDIPLEKSIDQLRNEVEYLKQEVEFLKKISSIKTTRK